jgi:hypothetical protein
MKTTRKSSRASYLQSPTAPILGGMRLLRASDLMPILGYKDRGSFWAAVRAAGMPYIRFNQRRIYFEESTVLAWFETKSVGRFYRERFGSLSRTGPESWRRY